MMNPEPSPTRSGPCSGAPGPPPGGTSGTNRRKNSSIGSFCCGAPRRLACVPALFVVMTFTTIGPCDFMSGVKSGSATTRLPLGLEDEGAPCAGAVCTANGPAVEPLLFASGSLRSHAASESATTPAMRIRRDIVSMVNLAARKRACNPSALRRVSSNEKPRRSGAGLQRRNRLVLGFAAGARAAAGARVAAAGRAGATRFRLAGVLRGGSMLFARELAVAVLVELGEVVVVRGALRFLFRDEAVLVLVQGLEHRFGAAVVLRGAAGGLIAGRGPIL